MIKVSGFEAAVVEMRPARLTLNDSDGSEFDGLLTNAGIMACVDHISHVFVGFRSLGSKRKPGFLKVVHNMIHVYG